MYTGIMHTHTLVVSLFLLIYLVKTGLLFFNKTAVLQTFSAKIKVPEMIISTLFLLTGVYLAINTGNGGNWLWAKLVAVFVSIPLAVIAFKKQNKNLALLSLMALMYAYGVSETKSAFFKPEEKPGTASYNGREVYETYCISCHGADGKLMLSGAKDLTLSPLTLDQRIALINSGKNAMPAYAKTLSAAQIQAVAVYTQTIK
ncbi:MAG: SirB2 family protein [Bacteroidia bacterium]|nr:SirB2 family protein [Bacteroidia bacterium]HQU99980.1 SirB2 family protein [Bacteroidia bacterium]